MGKAKLCGIYKIENTETGKVYIGSSEDINARWSRHIYNLKNDIGKKDMMVDYYKNGLASFSFNIVKECEPEKLSELEAVYYNAFKSQGYEFYKQYPKHFKRVDYTNGVRKKMSSNRKLTVDERTELIELLQRQELSKNDIAEIFGVSQTCVVQYAKRLDNQRLCS